LPHVTPGLVVRDCLPSPSGQSHLDAKELSGADSPDRMEARQRLSHLGPLCSLKFHLLTQVSSLAGKRDSALLAGTFNYRLLSSNCAYRCAEFDPARSICRAYPLPTTTHRALVSAPNVQTKLAIRLASWTATCSEAVGGCLLIRQTLIMASSMHRKDYKHSLLDNGSLQSTT
jgi:hypothetical protein